MKILFAVFLGGLFLSPGWLRAQVTAFSYQGRLIRDGNPANGVFDMEFTLYDASTNGTAVSDPLQRTAIVSNGVFSLRLDFGADAFPGEDRWLEIAVRNPSKGEPLETLSPRQRMTPVPYAYRASVATSLLGVTNAP